MADHKTTDQLDSDDFKSKQELADERGGHGHSRHSDSRK